MSHRSTALAELRRADRDRQRTKRQRMKAMGIPAPHQIDNAIAEALSFVIAISLADKSGFRAQTTLQSVPFGRVYNTALDILTKRWRFHPEHAASALKGRLAKRPEHFNRNWTPHYPWVDLAAPEDMSASISASSPVTPSGHVRTEAA